MVTTNSDHTATDLRRLASRENDGQVVRRLIALALILEGRSRADAAETSGMDRQTLRDWVHRYNAEGVPGLKSRVGGGHAPLLSKEQMAELRELVVNGPDPAVDGSCGGGVLICGRRSPVISRCRCTNGQLRSG